MAGAYVPQCRHQKGTQRPRPWSERGHCVPRRSGPLQPLDSLVEERGDWTGSGALKPFKVIDPSHPTRSHVPEQAECWVGHLGWGGRHSPAPPPPSIGCPESRGDSEFLATWVLCWGGNGTQRRLPSFLPPLPRARSMGRISAWRSSRGATSPASAWSFRTTVPSCRAGAGPRTVSTPSRCMGTARE